MKHTFLIFIFSVFATMGWGQTLGKIKFSSGGTSSNLVSSSFGDVFIPINNLITSTPESQYKIEFVAFPNPTEENINLQIFDSRYNDKFFVKILDITGRELLNLSYTGNSQVLQLGEFPVGTYSLLVFNKTNQKIFSKLIIKK